MIKAESVDLLELVDERERDIERERKNERAKVFTTSRHVCFATLLALTSPRTM